jgi:hypothetical protein
MTQSKQFSSNSLIRTIKNLVLEIKEKHLLTLRVYAIIYISTRNCTAPDGKQRKLRSLTNIRFNAVSFSSHFSNLRMKATYSSETTVDFQHTPRLSIPEQTPSSATTVKTAYPK